MSYMVLRGRWFKIIVLYVQAPSEEKNDDKTKQTYITTSNRFETLSPLNGSNSNEQTQPNTQLTPKPPPIFIYGVLTLILLMWRIWWAPNNSSKWQMGFNSAFKGLNYKKKIDNLSNITEEETYQCKILRNDTVKINTLNPDTNRKTHSASK